MEKYTESIEIFKKNEKQHLVSCNWQLEHDNFLLECWNLKGLHNGQEIGLLRIYQIWPDGNGYTEWKQTPNR